MTLSLMTPDEILSLKLDKDDARRLMIGNEAFGVVATFIPCVVHMMFIYVLFFQYTEHYTQIYFRLHAFYELFLRAIPLSLAHSSSANAYFQYGQYFGNISQIYVSHYLLICIIYYLAIWLVFFFFLLCDFIAVKQAGSTFRFDVESLTLIYYILHDFLRIEQDDISKVASWMILKLMSEPILLACTRGCYIFVISEGKVEVATMLSFYQSVGESICVLMAFIQADQNPQGNIFTRVALAYMISSLALCLVYVVILIFQNHKFIYFQLSRKYMFPINWTTVRKICYAGVPMLIYHGSVYFIYLLAICIFRFQSAEHADVYLTNSLFSVVFFEGYQALINGAIIAFTTHHAYYYGKQKYIKARSAMNTTLLLLMCGTGVIIIVTIISGLTICGLFANGTQFSVLSGLMTGHLNYMTHYYVAALLYPFSAFSRYLCYYKNSFLLASLMLISCITVVAFMADMSVQFPYSVDFSVIYYFQMTSINIPSIIFFIAHSVRDYSLILKYGDHDKYTPFRDN